ncbi:hypothetical protein [Sulfitobacter sabulilitoris]|uniref:Capsular biosynthesis protein n=1 Tax=Sulfitobacter sabulilitoris TaxID=2562655 RepID=A0A5S3PL13_9RHOB|nr:hypothetical protein [Sulfitobacter sabulilitoris]TMM55073.1 hypothetical protein FDT80_05750 [Sulfitobacter sabulilitoris]
MGRGTLREIVFHLPASWLGPAGSGLLPFYDHLTTGVSAAGHPLRLVPLDRAALAAQVAADDAFHIVNHGRMAHPRVLNCGIAYIYPFWNMDPLGIRAFSSIGAARFDPSQIDADQARPFFRKLRQRLVGARASRYAQPSDRAALPENCIAVFLQSEAHRTVGETCYLDRWDMLENILQNSVLPVVVKPHPRDLDPDTGGRLEGLQRKYANLSVSLCNIHDLLSVAARVVTINSAVGIEAYLHRKPVILCGQSDFHHIADVARSAHDLRRLLAAPPRRRAYDKFIHWYFAQQCLSTTDPDLTQRFLARVARGGAAQEN